MKRMFLTVVVILFVFVFSACVSSPEEQEVPVSANYNAIGLLSYISASFLDEQITVDVISESGIALLKNDKDKDEDEEEPPEFAIEDQMDRVNVYVDKLKRFISNGTDGFGLILEQDSDRDEYEFMVQVLVDEDEFLLYYNIDEETFVISGLFILDGKEYQIEAENSIVESKEEDQETKKNIMVRARSGADLIVVEYELKQEAEESKQLFTIVSNIDGVFTTLEIEIKNELNEYVLSITEGENEYTFKFETDEDGEESYKLEYIIDGVKGKVQIKEKVNEDGETIYVYRIQEKNEKIEIEMEDPDSDDGVPES